jgi:hypothetical protein
MAGAAAFRLPLFAACLFLLGPLLAGFAPVSGQRPVRALFTPATPLPPSNGSVAAPNATWINKTLSYLERLDPAALPNQTALVAVLPPDLRGDLSTTALPEQPADLLTMERYVLESLVRPMNVSLRDNIINRTIDCVATEVRAGWADQGTSRGSTMTLAHPTTGQCTRNQHVINRRR